MREYWLFLIKGRDPVVLHEDRGTIHRYTPGSGGVSMSGYDGVRAVARMEAGRSAYRLRRYPGRPGDYHPRIWRGSSGPQNNHDTQALYSVGRSITILFEMLQDIFRTVEPLKDNRKTFGHRLRHFLILTCTEIEAAWTGVLKANNCPPMSSFYTTKDYVRLHAPLRLNEWRLNLWSYDNDQDFVPFRGWNKAKATQSLPWYNAYNQVKHEGESNLQEATLNRAIAAAGALLIMAYAQFGTREFETLVKFTQKVFIVKSTPKWKPEELYYGQLRRGRGRRVDCQL